MKKMRLGVAYNLFDGEELLEASINSIRSEVDYICVIYQKKSYFNHPASDNIEDMLSELKNKKLIDEIYLYDEDFSKEKDKHCFEIKKRNIGLKLCKKAGCTHFLSMDVDEFYEKSQLASAKKYILRKNIKTSACSIFEYLKYPKYKLVNSYTFTPTEQYNFYVPFIMKINRFFPQSHNGKSYPCLVDPTRALNNKEKFHLFSIQDVVMHHMSTTRKDLGKKYANSNLNSDNIELNNKIKNLQEMILAWNFEANKINDKYALFDKKLVEKVDNIFNIEIN